MSSTEEINLKNINYSNDSNDTKIKTLEGKINKIIGYKHYNTIRINITQCTITNKVIDLILASQINIITNIQYSRIIIEGSSDDIDNIHDSKSSVDGSSNGDGDGDGSIESGINNNKNVNNKSIYKKIIKIESWVTASVRKIIKLYPTIYFYIEIKLNNANEPPSKTVLDNLLIDFIRLLQFCNKNLLGNIGINLGTDVFDINDDDKKQIIDLLDKFLEERENNKNKITINCDETSSKTKLYNFLMELLSKYGNPNKFVCKKNIEYQKLKQTQKKKLFNNEFNNNLSINSVEIEDIYQRFIKNYEDSLFMNYSKVSNSKDRASFYIKSIIDKINWALYEKEKPTNEIFIKKLIKTTLKFKNSIDTFPKQINYILTHGRPLLEIKKVPSDCIIIFLTPINRLNYTINYTGQILDLIKTKDFYEKFINNPICYGKNNWNELFTNSIVVLPNQYYYDLALSISPKDEEIFSHKTGIYSSSDNFQRKRYNTLNSTLSKEIDKNNFKGLIILNGCRGLNAEIETTLPLSETVNIYRYEHLIKILNKSIWFDNNKDYYQCDGINKIKDISKIIKNTKKDSIPKIYDYNEQKVKHLVKDENRSIGITIDLLQRVGFTNELILLFENLQTKLNSEYNCSVIFGKMEQIFDDNPDMFENIKNLLDYMSTNYENYNFIIKKNI